MRSLKRQKGMSISGMLIIAIMAGFYVMCFVKMVPHYFEYMSIKDIMTPGAMASSSRLTGLPFTYRRLLR